MVDCNQEAILKYKEISLDMLKYLFPMNSRDSLSYAVDYSIQKRFKDSNAQVFNNYTNENIDTTLLSIVNYILTKQPIITSAGVMWMHHGVVPNPFNDLLQKFIDNRTFFKTEMKKYPVRSEMYEKYNLFQLLAKIDANALYGALGQFSCIFYNLHLAESTTTQARSYTAAALLFFEAFLSDNVKFGSLNEIVTFIHNVVGEKNERKYDSREIFGTFTVSAEECWYKLMSNCGFFYIPSEDDLEIVYNICQQLSEEDRIRIYFKNNLFSFFEMAYIKSKLISIFNKLDEPFMNPNKPPECIKKDMDFMIDIIKEYVYYGHQYIDRLSRIEEMPRNNVIITDTDSTITSLDAWFNYTLGVLKNSGVDIPVSHYEYDARMAAMSDDSDAKIEPIEYVQDVLDYSFENDEIIRLKNVGIAYKIIPQDALRYSIVNFMAYICGDLIVDYMERYTKNTYSYDPDSHKCMIIMKNEFLFKRLLATGGKKNYADIQELKEGQPVPQEMSKSLSIMGLPIDKSTLPEQTRKTLQKILYEDILNCREIDQLTVLKHIKVFEKTIIEQLKSGDKSYFKPASVKPMAAYADPYRIQSVKASIAYNGLKEDGAEAIDMEAINAISIIKVDISPKTIEKIKDSNPEKYNQIQSFLAENEVIFKGSIDAIALPLSEPVPKWLIEFIDYATIVNDNIKTFPLQSIGLYRFDRDNINYTNILKL